MTGRQRALLRLCTGLFLLFVCTAHGNLESLDSTFTLQAARALWLRGDSGLRTSDQAPQWRAEAEAADYIAGCAAAGEHVYGKRGRNGLVYVWFPVGHVWLMVPCVAIGEGLGRMFPVVEERYRERTGPLYPQGMFVFAQAAVAMVLPALTGALSVLLLFCCATVLGAGTRDATITALSIAFATQFFALARETLSDGPGLCFLLGAMLPVLQASRGSPAPWSLLLGGLAAGAAVLTRYQHGVVVPVLLVALLLAARRQRRWSLPLWFLAGGLPCLLLLLGVNAARFGSPLDTGYPSAGSWFNYPLWFGLTKLLIAAGKGILWLSPLLWLGVPAACRRDSGVRLRWLAWTMLVIPLLMFGSTNGWQSGQCWGARYVTPGIVLFLLVVLAQAQPWRRWPRVFWALCAVGGLANLTSVVAPMRGHNQLAGQAVRAMYEQEFARGAITRADLDNLDPADHFFFLPRFSPLHAHWTYALRSATGGFEDAAGLPRNGVEHTIEPLFGVTSAAAGHGLAPVHWEDRGFRHLWFVFFGTLLGLPWWLLLLPVAAVAGWMALPALRRLSQE